MTSFLLRVAVSGVGLWVASLLVPGIAFDDDGSTLARVLTVGAVALVFGVLNAVLRPILLLLSLPLLVLTLGLFLLILNAIMLSLTSWLAGMLDLGFVVRDFWWDAVLGALVVTIVTMILQLVLPDGE